MKSLTKSILIVLCVTLLSSAQLFGQEWSEEQKEVWTTVENWQQAWAEGDLDKINSFVSDDYRLWREDSHAPFTLKESQPWWEDWTKKIKPPGIFHLHPFAIDIHGDIAIVFLSYQVVDKLKDGSEIKEQGKWTEIYRKIDGKWLVISETGFDFKTTSN